MRLAPGEGGDTTAPRERRKYMLPFCTTSFGRACVLAGAVVAIGLVFAGAGGAASKNICAVPSTGTPPNLTGASCVHQFVGPHFISPGSDALSVTEFNNESGGATATHLVLGVRFPTTDVAIRSVDGVSLALSGCTPDTSAGQLTISCPVGNVAGGGGAKMTVRFAPGPTVATSMRLTGTATYGEGTGTPGQPPNSVQVNYDTLTLSSDASADGGCFDAPQPVRGTNGLQTTYATLGAAAADTSLPCTFVDAGVLDNSLAAPGTIHSQISFDEFPTLAGSSPYATVRIQFTPLPPGVNLNKLKLLEDTNYAAPFFTTFITVPNCDKSGNIPAPVGIPAFTATDLLPHANDSCIYNRSPLPSGGGEVDLHAIGSPFDSHYGG